MVCIHVSCMYADVGTYVGLHGHQFPLQIFVLINLLILQDCLVTEKKEKPVSMNAFELISRSQSFNLENLFEKQAVCIIRFLWFHEAL